MMEMSEHITAYPTLLSDMIESAYVLAMVTLMHSALTCLYSLKYAKQNPISFSVHRPPQPLQIDY